MDKSNEYFIITKDNFIEFMKGKGYRDSTLVGFSNKIDNLYSFLKDNNLSLNKDGIDLYLSYVEKRNIKKHSISLIKCAITRFNDFINGDYILFHPYNQATLPSISDKNRELLNDYIDHFIKKGNKESTIKQKIVTITRFISECEKIVADINMLNGEILCDILTVFYSGRVNEWPIISNFLLHLFRENHLSKDLSLLIPKTKRKETIPTVYTIDEIKRIEDEIDSSTFKGKRDKAALLLATRLGVRASDIVNLELSNFDFEKKQLTFVQVKTGNPITLPIVNDLKEASLDYIKERNRVETSTKKLFIRAHSPYGALIKGAALDHVLDEYFKKAGVDTSNKKHGLHSLRSSLASSMVNDNVPYEIVRKVLGHSDDNVIKHYARLDIEELRKCALKVPPPSGRFGTFLDGGLKDE